MTGPAATTVPANTSVPVGTPASGAPASTVPASTFPPNTSVPAGTPGSGVSWCQVQMMAPGSYAGTTTTSAG